jgi:1,4-alpha-glucan branching enzyme
MQHFHGDGIRVDAVNSIIRLDFSRKEGEWERNEYGGNENIEAIHFLKRLNEILYQDFPDIQTIAEEASDWPGMTLPTHAGGFGFGMKWMMGWMHDSFRYFKTHPADRHHIQNTFTFSMMYFYDENFMLPLSHDEIVHGKSPMIYKMPGDTHEKFANLRMLYAYMYTHPGAKLLFMGDEFAQTTEWNEASELEWHLLTHVSHQKMKDCVIKLSHLYKDEPALYEYQFDPKGFEWLMLDSGHDGVMAYKRKGKYKINDLVIVINTSAKNYQDYGIVFNGKTEWNEIFNSDDDQFWGTGKYMNKNLTSKIVNKKTSSIEIKLSIPALSVMIFR